MGEVTEPDEFEAAVPNEEESVFVSKHTAGTKVLKPGYYELSCTPGERHLPQPGETTFPKCPHGNPRHHWREV